LQNHSSARDFLHTFSQDPLQHLQTWLASQSRDLDAILGAASSIPGAGVNSSLSNEEMRRADTFQGAWLDEAITGHIALDTARRKKEMERSTARQAMVQSQQQQ
jgi:SWI/SNF-related matrix-associated actin-dependent regulator of chromatin subfamily D